MKAKIKTLALATGLLLPTLGMSQELINTLQCVDFNPCYEEMAYAQTILESGAQRPLEMFIENSGESIGITFSEVMGLSKAFLNMYPGRGMPAALTAMMSDSDTQSGGTPSYRSLEDYRTVEMVQINDSLFVAIYKPTEQIVIRRDYSEGESTRVTTSFEDFISTLQQGYEKFSKEPIIQSYVGLDHHTTDTTTITQFQRMYVSTTGNDLSVTGEHFREENVQYTAYHAVVDRKGEETRDLCFSSTTRVNGTSGYTSGSISTNGCTPDHQDINVDPHVSSVRDEIGINVNGNVTVGSTLNIDIYGEDSITRHGSDEDYDDWKFSDNGLQLFGGLDDTTSDGAASAMDLFNQYMPTFTDMDIDSYLSNIRDLADNAPQAPANAVTTYDSQYVGDDVLTGDAAKARIDDLKSRLSDDQTQSTGSGPVTVTISGGTKGADDDEWNTSSQTVTGTGSVSLEMEF